MLLLLVVLAATVAVLLLRPIHQDLAYHRFADCRTALGVPHFWNTVTNVAFVIVGLSGLRVLGRGPVPGGLPELRPAYRLFFLGVVLTGFGSGWYHLDPTNASLVWDRLPMTISLTAFVAIVVGEHISVRLGRQLLWSLLGLGLASVVYWATSEAEGKGDLRPYGLVQFLPMLLVPLILILFRSAFAGNGYVWFVLASYAAAKVAELADGQLFRLSSAEVGGHALKHLLAALGAWFLVLALHRRRVREAGVDVSRSRVTVSRESRGLLRDLRGSRDSDVGFPTPEP